MSNWSKEDILAEIKTLSNKELLEQTVASAAGDDYDGCFTPEGDFRFDSLRTELSKRLKEAGWIEHEAFGEE